MGWFDTLAARAGSVCELCGSEVDLGAVPVPPGGEEDTERSVLACGTCRAQLEGAPLDPDHWYCLQGAAWSEVPAVQVVAWRLLHRLSDQGWAVDLLDQMALDDATARWARDVPEPRAETRDSHGAALADGDTVTLIKDLDVKGGGFVAKRGTVVKGIRLTDDPEAIEGKVNGTTLVLKTAFLKRA